MQVVIIGSGNVATVFSRLVNGYGHTILQIVSKKLSNAEALAKEFNTNFTDNLSTINLNADLYIIAITDDALNNLPTSFNVVDKLVVHTAGSISKNILSTISTNYGVLYPLQSLLKKLPKPENIPLLIDGNNEFSTKKISNFANTISSIVSKATDEERLKLHVAAVIVNNFTNHLFTLTQDFCQKENVDFKLLLPLVTETIARLETHTAADMQTGPASRNDTTTINNHLALLSKYPRLKKLYLQITGSILDGI